MAVRPGKAKQATAAGFWGLNPVWTLRLLFFLLALAPAYITVARYDPAAELHGDQRNYVLQYERAPLDQIERPFRWRVLTPWAASLLPDLPDAFFRYYQNDPSKSLRFKFMVVNGAGTVATACLLLALLGAWGFSLRESALGALLYLFSFQSLANGYTVFVDGWTHAAIVACLLAARRRRHWVLGLIFAVGLFNKESVVFALPWVWLAEKKDARLGLVLAMLPGALAYAAFRFSHGGGPGPVLDRATYAAELAQFMQPAYLAYVAMEFALNFYLLGPLAVLGWETVRREQPHLARMAWILPLLFVLPWAVYSEFARVWFLSFPILIPAAVLGLRRVFGWSPGPAWSRAA